MFTSCPLVRICIIKPGLEGERETQIVAHNLNNFRPIVGYKTWLTQLGLTGERCYYSYL